MTRILRADRRALLAAALLAAAAPRRPRRRPSTPSKPITFVVPFAAGSATDQLARALGQSITEQTRSRRWWSTTRPARAA